MEISKAQANKVIEQCYRAIPYNLFDGIWEVRERLYNMELADEKQHRRGRDAVKGFSMAQAAKYFTVKHLYEGLTAKYVYTVDDVTKVRLVCMYAQAYARKFGAELQEFKNFVEQSEFDKVDYPDMMK